MGIKAQRMIKWPLTSREIELERLSRVWSDRQCKGVLLRGSAGVGKSRLAEEFLALVVRNGLKGWRVTASAASAVIPLGAISHLMPPHLDLRDPVNSIRMISSAEFGPQPHSSRAVWVDDIHLLDGPSAMLLRELVDAQVIRLIATIRSGEPVREAVSELICIDDMYQLEVSAFSKEQVDAMLNAALNGPVSRRTLHDLYAVSNGNALYLHELVLGALDSGVMTSNGEIWEISGDRLRSTPKLIELVKSRVASVNSAERDVLELLALCGPLPLTDALQAASSAAVFSLERSGLITTSTSRHRATLQLAHPLHGEVLRDAIPVLRRRALLMGQVDRTLSYGARRRDDALHIATWKLAATGSADPNLLIRAATLARHAHDYRQTIKLLQAVPSGQSSSKSMLLLGEAHFELGDFELAEHAFSRAEELSRDETQRISIVIERTQSLFWGAGRLDDGLAANTGALAITTDPILRKVLMINEGCMRIAADDPNRGLELLHGVEEFPDPRVRLYGMAVKSAGLQATGKATEALLLCEKARIEHEESAEETVLQTSSWQLIYTAMAQCSAGQLEQALAAADQAYANTVTKHAPLPQGWAALVLAQGYWLTGRVAEARRWFAESLARGRRHRLPSALRLSASGLAASCAVMGDLVTAKQVLADFDTYPHHTVYWEGQERLGEAWLLAAYGRVGEARAVLMRAASSARNRGHISSEALLLTDAARLGGAKLVRNRLASLADICDGALTSTQASLAAALATGDPKHLMQVAEYLHALGSNLLAAEAATQAAAAWQRAREGHKAGIAAQMASACANRCQGARTPLLATGRSTAALTAREKEIALLAAGGAASKEIAQLLDLSVRTVDNHLQRVFAKLGVSSRRHLASKIGTPGL